MAVVLSEAEYRRLTQPRRSFAEALRAFRAKTDFAGLGNADVEEAFRDVRSRGGGRDSAL